MRYKHHKKNTFEIFELQYFHSLLEIDSNRKIKDEVIASKSAKKGPDTIAAGMRQTTNL